MAPAGDTFADAGRVIAELRMQRELLAGIAAEVGGSQHELTVPMDGSWRSTAQREFAGALDELGELLGTARRALDAAVAEIDADLATLAAGVM